MKARSPCEGLLRLLAFTLGSTRSALAEFVASVEFTIRSLTLNFSVGAGGSNNNCIAMVRIEFIRN